MSLRDWLLSLDDRLHFLIVVGSTIITAFVVAFSVQFFFEALIFDKDVVLVGVIYQVVGTIYAVLIAFTLLGVWQNFSKAQLSVQTEAFALLDLVQIVEAGKQKNNIREVALSYLELVTNKEWPTLKKLGPNVVTRHEVSRLASIEMTRAVQQITPKDARETAIFNQTLALLSAWLDARRVRILIAQGNTAKALWPLLLTGAFFLFSFHGFFIASTNSLWISLLFGFSVIIGLSFYLIFSLDYPFSGNLCVDANPFRWAISSLKTYKPQPE